MKFIRLQFTDIFGTLKNVAITTSQVEKALDNKCMFDGSSIEGFVRIEESDMYLWPDLDTFAILPWHTQHGQIARLICDVYKPDGTPFEGRPALYPDAKRSKRRRTWDIASTWGRSANFSCSTPTSRAIPPPSPHDTAGYFDMGPVRFG